MRFPIQATLVAITLVALTSCVGGTPTDPPTPTSGVTSVTPSQTQAAHVPSPEELVDHLVEPSDLGPTWVLWEGFADWPSGVPGVIPEDQRTLIPQLTLCPSAGDDAVALASGLRWEVFTQLHHSTADEFSNMLVAQQLLLAGEPGEIASTFTTLRDGLFSCLTENLPSADWEIGLREPLEVPEVGDARFAERSLSFDPSGVRRETRLVLVQAGSVLLLVQLDEILITPDSVAELTQDQVNELIETIAQRLP